MSLFVQMFKVCMFIEIKIIIYAVWKVNVERKRSR